MDQQNSRPQRLAFSGLLALALVAFALFQTKFSPETAGWRENWREATPFHLPRRALAAVAGDGFLYVIGGVDDSGNYVRETEFTRIRPDGSLEPWRITTALPEGRIYLAATVVHNHIYVIGGGQGELGSDNFPVALVEKAAILADGSLGPWQQEHYLTTPRRGLKLVTYGDRIYAIGGYNGRFLKTIERTSAAPDGSLGEWRLEAAQSLVDRYIHSATIANDTVYLLGGHVQGGTGMSYGDVESSRLTDDGSLVGWTIEQTRLTTPRFIASSFALNDFLYILGGHNGALRLRSVEFAPLDAHGRVGRWTPTAEMIYPRSATALAVAGDFVYVAGGMGETGALNSVEMAAQRDDGRLGWRRRR